jgi:hypothetical protein
MKVEPGTVRVIVILCSAIPFLFFWHKTWMQAALLGYLMTALFFCVVLAGEYPPFASKWFWRAMVPIILVHCSLVASLVWLDFAVPYLNRLPRALYGLATILLTAEWRFAMYLIDASDPSTEEA